MAQQKANLSQAPTRLLGYVEGTSNFSTANTTATQITGMTITLTPPTGVTQIKVTGYCSTLYCSTAQVAAHLSLWQGTAGTGTQLQDSRGFQGGNSGTGAPSPFKIVTVTPGTSYTFNLALNAETSTTATAEGASTRPIILMAEVV